MNKEILNLVLKDMRDFYTKDASKNGISLNDINRILDIVFTISKSVTYNYLDNVWKNNDILPDKGIDIKKAISIGDDILVKIMDNEDIHTGYPIYRKRENNFVICVDHNLFPMEMVDKWAYIRDLTTE